MLAESPAFARPVGDIVAGAGGIGPKELFGVGVHVLEVNGGCTDLVCVAEAIFGGEQHGGRAAGQRSRLLTGHRCLLFTTKAT